MKWFGTEKLLHTKAQKENRVIFTRMAPKPKKEVSILPSMKSNAKPLKVKETVLKGILQSHNGETIHAIHFPAAQHIKALATAQMTSEEHPRGNKLNLYAAFKLPWPLSLLWRCKVPHYVYCACQGHETSHHAGCEEAVWHGWGPGQYPDQAWGRKGIRPLAPACDAWGVANKVKTIPGESSWLILNIHFFHHLKKIGAGYILDISETNIYNNI